MPAKPLSLVFKVDILFIHPLPHIQLYFTAKTDENQKQADRDPQSSLDARRVVQYSDVQTCHQFALSPRVIYLFRINDDNFEIHSSRSRSKKLCTFGGRDNPSLNHKIKHVKLNLLLKFSRYFYCKILLFLSLVYSLAFSSI